LVEEDKASESEAEKDKVIGRNRVEEEVGRRGQSIRI